MVHFCVNTWFLFREVPFLERFGRVAQAGFAAVEFPWPEGEDLDEVVAAVREAGLKVALFNFYAGSLPAGDRGVIHDPDREALFHENVPRALDLAERLSCPRINALAGNAVPGRALSDQLALAARNVAWAADQAARRGIEIVIEPLNTLDNRPHLISTSRQAAEFIEQVGRPNVRIQYDVYHMQIMEGNLIHTLRQRIGEIGHIQIADVPGRGEPGTGEINFTTLLREIDRLGYPGYIGLEYIPTTATTEPSLAWLPADRRGSVPAEALQLSVGEQV